jgi:hypothetical protein
MNIQWLYFVTQYDAARYVSSADGRDHGRVQFVREFGTVASVLQVITYLLAESFLAHLSFKTGRIMLLTCIRIFLKLLRTSQRVHTQRKPSPSLWAKIKLL